MMKRSICGSGLCAVLLAGLAGCSSSSSGGTVTTKSDASTKPDSGGTKPDGGHDAATSKPEAGEVSEGGVALDAGPPRTVLVTYAGTAPTTVFAVNLDTNAIVGKVTSTDSDAITDTSNRYAPFLINQHDGNVVLINSTTWTADGNWSVALPVDGGVNGTDPVAVGVASESQVYVLRNTSNVIDVFDVTTPVDGGAPTTSIDLSSLVQPADEDGVVDPAAAVYVASSKRLYVVLENIDTYAVDDFMGSYDTICTQTISTVIAIDTTTNKVVSLNGSGPGGGIALAGFDPTSAVYDAAGGRILLFEAGCNPAATSDGGAPGALKQRGVEAVDLTANTSKVLLDASTQGFPGNLVYIDPTHAVVGFTYPTYVAYSWDPTSATLGAALPNAPQLFDSDGNGNLVGASVNYGDGGSATTDIVSMSIATGKVTTLQSNVIDLGTGGYLSSVGVWPRP